MSANGGPLDLSDANTSGFEALDAGRYNATVFAMVWDAVKNTSGEGKLPAGTPMLKVQFQILDPKIGGEPIEGDRRAFSQYVIPPNDYDKTKAATMKGMFVRFLMALGEDETKVKSKKFDFDPEDYVGRECTVTLSKVPKYGTAPEENEWENKVKGVSKAGAGVGGGGLL